ncbi:PrgI family protein [Haloechinothrix salitolerans]|uniref:PrgI family protein n=1 Tax=Haloechinothrix salitolerans TaxID=926830 RepID=A0ABW2BXM7_9PSEU
MTQSVRIPADVDREDRILAGFTARQVLVMAVTALVLYGGWQTARAIVPVTAYLVVAAPLGVAVCVMVVVRRDGVTLDRLFLAAIRQRLQPRRRVPAGQRAAVVPDWLADVADSTDAAPPGQLQLPATGVTEAGVVDLGADGLALIGVCSTVNFALRTPAEQQALTTAFGRYLHSLSGRVQILVRVQRLDLSEEIADLRHRAQSLPHPALEQAALDHAEYLERLGEQADLLRRQVLLVLREPVSAAPPDSVSLLRHLWLRSRSGDREEHSAGTRRAATSRLLRRMHEASELLAPAGIEVTTLDAAHASAVLTAATNPDSLFPPSPEMAGPDEVITTAASTDWDVDEEV